MEGFSHQKLVHELIGGSLENKKAPSYQTGLSIEAKIHSMSKTTSVKIYAGTILTVLRLNKPLTQNDTVPVVLANNV